MISVIIPLAGPDLLTPDGALRPFHLFDGQPLLARIIQARRWLEIQQDVEIIFVIRDIGPITTTLSTKLKDLVPNCKIATLSHLTDGSLQSVLAGLSLCSSEGSGPLIFDLADILFDYQPLLVDLFIQDPNVMAVAPWFRSQNKKFSYFELDGRRVLKAREKEVISEYASAGVYAFRDVKTAAFALSWGIGQPEISKVGNAHFICPTLNALVDVRGGVQAVEVSSVVPVSLEFH